MRVLGWVAMAATASAVGCAAPDEGAPSSDATDTATTHAYITVEREGVLGDESSARARASATFIRTRDESDLATAARLVGATAVTGEFGCHRVATESRAIALGALDPVELVHAGDITITAGETRTSLSARAYPDVAHLVSGVVYTSPDEVADVLPGAASITLRAAGSAAVPPFEIVLAVPSPLRDVAASGVSLRDPDARVALGDLALTWAADDERAGEVVWVDLGTNVHGRLVCVAPIGASLELPRAELPETGDLSLTLHRARTTPFAAENAVAGELSVDTAIDVRVARFSDDAAAE